MQWTNKRVIVFLLKKNSQNLKILYKIYSVFLLNKNSQKLKILYKICSVYQSNQTTQKCAIHGKNSTCLGKG